MGGFNPVGAPNTGYYPLGLVTTPQNAFWTQTCEYQTWRLRQRQRLRELEVEVNLHNVVMLSHSLMNHV